MAVFNGILSVTVKDADKEVTAVPFYCDVADTVDLADLKTLSDSFQDVLDPVLDGMITRVRMIVDLPLAIGNKADPVAGSEIERTALLTNTVTGSIYPYSTDLPAFAESLYDGNAVPNTGDAATFETFLTVPHITASFNFTDRYANPLTDFVRWVKTFRKHRKQTKRAG